MSQSFDSRERPGAAKPVAPATLKGQPAVPSPAGATRWWVGAWRVSNESGSRYVIVQDDDGGWWFAGQNVPNLFSAPLPPGFGAIEPPSPSPPRLGDGLALVALRCLALDDPRRVPGGGNRTSDVRIVAPLSLTAGEP